MSAVINSRCQTAGNSRHDCKQRPRKELPPLNLGPDLGVSPMTWNPRARGIEILDAAMKHIQSVNYKVSLRWVFYSLLQAGTLRNKDDYKALKGLLATARKEFYQDWAPDTLADDTRPPIYAGDGWETPVKWLSGYVAAEQSCLLDVWKGQRTYVEIAFEAKAMAAQFEHYTRNTILRAFGGDYSIAAKWLMAKQIEERWERLGHPQVVILYFGDLDEKGMQIPISAERDVFSWCECDFEWHRIGLNPGDEKRFDLPENPDRPGAFQWEALPDDAANELISTAFSEYVDLDLMAEREEEQAKATDRFQEEIYAMAENWKDDDDEEPE